MRFKQFLLESLEKVYHALPEKALISILKDDRIEFVPNTSIERKDDKEKFYYISTMRNKSGRYFILPDTKDPRLNVYFEINYDTLKSVAKSKPVDYWQAGPKGKEQEERFYLDKPYLENVKKYINSIHVLIKKDEDNSNEKSAQILNQLAHKRQIPIYFYDNSQNYILGKNPIEFLERSYEESHKDIPYEISAIIKLYNDEKLNKKEYNYLKDLIRYYNWNKTDSVTYLTNWLHRSMKTDDKNSRESGRMFTEAMRKEKTINMEKFLEKVIEKSKKKFNYEI